MGSVLSILRYEYKMQITRKRVREIAYLLRALTALPEVLSSISIWWLTNNQEKKKCFCFLNKRKY